LKKLLQNLLRKFYVKQLTRVLDCYHFKFGGLLFGLGLKGDAYKNFLNFLPKLANAYDELDASLLEINPLVQTSDNQIIALDAKINFDDNANLPSSSIYGVKRY